jgi:hypothetical protein
MSFPLVLSDLSLLLAVTAIILLITSELLSPSYGNTNIYINNKRLKNAALTVSILFLVTLAIRIINMVINP